MIKGIPINPALEKALPKFEAGFFQNNRADTPTDTPRASAAEGDEYGEDEIEVSELSTVTVETGMSDGSYILVESDELAEGDLIVVTRLTSTQTGSDSQGSGGMGGGFPGGGMDFGDFDFENFDPGTMPQGGGFCMAVE